MGLWKRLKKRMSKWLEKLAEDNQKTFGSTTPDCCKLNRDNQVKK